MLTEEQIDDAIKQAIVHCKIMEETQYDVISLRACLYVLGYTELQADEVIVDCASRGFTNCIDPMIAVETYPDFKPEYPSEGVCYWGCDQLRSRLESLHPRSWAQPVNLRRR